MSLSKSILKKVKWLKYFKNKYLFSFTIFFVFALFLDDYDIFYLISQKRKCNKIEDEISSVSLQLNETKKTLKQLNNPKSLEKYAREEKYFKMDDEDLFVISYE
ncbi:MAG: septum formation initiator family protein [Flavobacteriia bacterium]|nr:septum formation initiator family protein [Flavobacteriia bacterium]